MGKILEAWEDYKEKTLYQIQSTTGLDILKGTFIAGAASMHNAILESGNPEEFESIMKEIRTEMISYCNAELRGENET
jgi:hypothetical protein